MKRIYLAGPQVFLENPEPYYTEKQALCEKYGFEGVAPFDSSTDYSYRPVFERGLVFSHNNEKLMDSCSYIAADITPFRSVSADVGTAYEIGYMRAKKCRIFCYSNTDKTFFQRTTDMHTLTDPNKDAFGMQFENFGMVDNLMIHGSVIYSGGATFVGEVPERELYTYLGVFEELLKYMRKMDY